MWLKSAVAFYERILKVLTLILFVISGAFLVVMMAITGVDVLLRNAIKQPIPGAIELTAYFMGIVVAFGLAHTGILKGHIFVDLVTDRLPKRTRSVLFIITNFTGFVFISLMAWQSFLHMEMTKGIGIISAMLSLPAYPFIGAVAVGCVLYALVLLKDCLELLSQEVGK